MRPVPNLLAKPAEVLLGLMQLKWTTNQELSRGHFERILHRPIHRRGERRIQLHHTAGGLTAATVKKKQAELDGERQKEIVADLEGNTSTIARSSKWLENSKLKIRVLSY